MASDLIHKQPCPLSPFSYKIWDHASHAKAGRICNCPEGWPCYSLDLTNRRPVSGAKSVKKEKINMDLKIKIDMDNAAFDGKNGGGLELCRILHAIGTRLEDFDGRADRGAVMDINGNTVGTWSIR